jgi:4-nitrophenyl phosphatase
MQWTDLKQLALKYDYFLFDCDGVLWHGEKTHIGQSFRNIEWLESLGKTVFFVTNNASISRETLAKKMQNEVF